MPELGAETRNLISTMLAMAGLLAVLAVGVQIILVYRRRLHDRSGDPREELAESFREAYEAGEIDTDEYRQIRTSIERGPIPDPPRPSPPTPPEPGPDAPDLDDQAPRADPAEEDSA
ncbi:SHOCT domain-containing protein [Tautonia plasticadhaerens]|uniref:SHOCT domain-containing protein n=1 Tax=Tautonia plasticadhaerens TaxID=2527974 RepID=A0A518HB82_9BACT|nr:hypothetical protein [Tautonia plasticadhaerens]QDV38081.1 hypothetical protein ElP_60290 [Tautonia plasticadhaerens]